jgi:hypothetical protein
VFPWLIATRRAWLYRVLTAGAGLAAVYGIVAENTAAGWLGFGAALLGSGTAVAHTPTTVSLRRGVSR